MEKKVQIIKGNSLIENDHGDTKTTKIFDCEVFNIAKIRKIGDDIKTGYDTESDVAYYVLEGKGKCVIKNKEYEIEKGDLIFYPKGTPYKHLKGLTLLAIANPPFDRKKRVYIE
ncbi:MAG: cupin domain-containing protein [Nanoarchaeales archaeon]|nr:cupin domain-containing protein [Nanoarchaeales archaeon]